MRYVPCKNRGRTVCYIIDGQHLYPISDTNKIYFYTGKISLRKKISITLI